MNDVLKSARRAIATTCLLVTALVLGAGSAQADAWVDPAGNASSGGVCGPITYGNAAFGSGAVEACAPGIAVSGTGHASCAGSTGVSVVGAAPVDLMVKDSPCVAVSGTDTVSQGWADALDAYFQTMGIASEKAGEVNGALHDLQNAVFPQCLHVGGPHICVS